MFAKPYSTSILIILFLCLSIFSSDQLLAAEICEDGTACPSEIEILSLHSDPSSGIEQISSNNFFPIGTVESWSCDAIVGWAFDPDTASTSIQVEFEINGTYAGQTTADIYRPDVNQSQDVTGNHGFSWSVPNSFRDGTNLNVLVRALDENFSAGPDLDMIIGENAEPRCRSETGVLATKGAMLTTTNPAA